MPLFRLPSPLCSVLLARGPARSATVWLVSMLACAACSNGSGNSGDKNPGEAGFGTAPPTLDPDAATEEDVGNDMDAGESTSEQVRLRVFHGILNLPAARFCHDRDYQADDPYTTEDEYDPGQEPAYPILGEFLDGGALPLGVPAGYFTLDGPLTGAIMVHRAPLPAAAGADAGNALSDAGRAGGAGASDAAVDPCDPATLEAVLPLPLTAAWLEPPRPVSDAGADLPASDAGRSDAGALDAGPTAPERRGFVTTLRGAAPLTLFGSGRSLDPKQVALRRMSARDNYLVSHPDESAQAEATGRATQAWLESTLGPRFLPSRASPALRKTWATLSFVHLIPDVVASVDGGTPLDQGTPSSAALHMCVQTDAFESDVPEGRGARLEFRNFATLGPFDPDASYRFRLFVEADFTRTQAICGVTSLRPVAEMRVSAGRFQPEKSYTLVAWGARSPNDLCTAYEADTVVRPGCARPAEALNASILVLDDELPAAP